MRRINAVQAGALAMRDPAEAALMGALPGSHFAGEGSARMGAASTFGAEMGGTFGDESPYGAEVGMHGMGAFGAFGAAAPGGAIAPHQPSQAQLMAMWHHHNARHQHTQRRMHILHPNQGSEVQVTRYVFTLTQLFVLGTPQAFNVARFPTTAFRPQRLVTNVPSPGFVQLDSMQIANVNAFVGGSDDAFTYSAGAQGVTIDLPTMQPNTPATMTGSYSGLTPPPFTIANPFNFIMSFQGPAEVTA